MAIDCNEDAEENTQPLKILGIEIGTCIGWFDGDAGTFGIHGYVPNEAFKGKIEPGDLWFDFNEGLLKYYDDFGNITKEVKLLELFKVDV